MSHGLPVEAGVHIRADWSLGALAHASIHLHGMHVGWWAFMGMVGQRKADSAFIEVEDSVELAAKGSNPRTCLTCCKAIKPKGAWACHVLQYSGIWAWLSRQGTATRVIVYVCVPLV